MGYSPWSWKQLDMTKQLILRIILTDLNLANKNTGERVNKKLYLWKELALLEKNGIQNQIALY